MFMRSCFTSIALTLFFLVTGCGSEDGEQQIDCSAAGLMVNIQRVDYADCGLENGRITVDATGGTSPYTFELDNGMTSSTGVFEDLATNYYTITVRDKNNCSMQRQTFVGSNDGVRAVAFTTPSGCGGTNGTITITARNGVEPYKYQLGENSDYTDSNEFNNLQAGSYSVWVRDANDCGLGIYIDVLSGISYENDISGIFASSCSASGCHDGTTDPDLSTLKGIQDNSEAVLTVVLNKSMPPVTPLSGEEIRNIECWIKDGTPDN